MAHDDPADARHVVPGLSDAPKLRLDELLAQLVARAEEVISAQDRLGGLLNANRMIIGDLALPVVLRRIVEAGCQLVNARYGALGVLSPAGGLAEFIHVGIDDGVAREIGHLPEGKGLLGALIDDPRPIRLHAIADDPRSVGFPANHPPMSSFLGVPIRVRNEIFGNLYLTERVGGDFTVEDEELVTALAATAGVAIENARLYGEARRRQDWLEASAQITRQLLSVSGEDPLQLIARRAREVADADLVSVVLTTPDGERLMVEVASGTGAETLVGMTYDRENTLAAITFDTGKPILVADVQADPERYVHLVEAAPIGPVIVLPLLASEGVRGALVVGRLRNRARFDEADLDMATSFANHAALALELSDARDTRQRMVLLEDRERIARDLHDHVIQRLFATGLTIQSVAAAAGSEKDAGRLSAAVGDIDETIRQIRTTIFRLRGSLVPNAGGVRAKVIEIVDDTKSMLGFEPNLRFDGPVDSTVPDGVIGELLAVVRESLTNVARHARATHVDVAIAVGGEELNLVVVDDGVGLGEGTRRSGLANMQLRAERLNGTMSVTDAQEPGTDTGRRGTKLQWKVPLP
jgi:two-component system, NarL family, sensor histidine kinase DevS